MKIFKAILAIAILSVSCSKDNDEPQPQPEIPKETVDVYLLGQELIANKYVAKYWKNNIATILNLDTNSSVSVSGMVVSGTDVFVSGSETSSGFTFPCLWKNGVRNVLPAPSPQPMTTAIAISGADVYTSGTLPFGNNKKAVYWKNQTFIELTNGSDISSTSGIAFSGNNVYVIGSTQAADNISYISKIWINGQPKIISNQDSRVLSIFINGTDIYISGKEKNSSDVFLPIYWKYDTIANVFTKVTLNTYVNSMTAEASSIFVSGTDVYVAGFDRNDSGRDFANYWKNGQKKVLSDGSKDAYCSSIYINKNDVYVSGSDDNILKHWKNNVATNYTNGTNTALAYSIIVTEK